MPASSVLMQIVEIGNEVKVSLRGRLDTVGVSDIEARFTAALVPPGRNAIVDLSEVDFVASLGIRMFIATARGLSRKNARLVLFGPQAMVRQAFTSVSLPQIIPVLDDESAALVALRS